MKYTNGIVYRYKWLALCWVLAMGGCSSLPSPLPSQESTDVTKEETEGEAQAEKTANPYLSNPRPVPGGVARRYSQAVKYMREEKWRQAESLLLAITEEAPNLSGPWLNLGIIYRKTKVDEQAVEAFTKAIAINENNLDAYNHLALIKREAGEFKGAETLYRQALDRWPHHMQSHRNLAILYDLYMGKLEPALEHYETVQRLLEQPDQILSGWIVDLKRRMRDVAQVGEGQ